MSSRNDRRIRLRRLKRLWVVYYLQSHPCIDCGEADYRKLVFDHRDPSEKFKDVGDLVNNESSLSKIIEEISKCDVRCANCHSVRTADQFGYYHNALAYKDQYPSQASIEEAISHKGHILPYPLVSLIPPGHTPSYI